MSWKWTVQLNKTSIRWTSIRTVCMESPLQGSLWPLTSASHMTIHNPKSELWPVILPVNMPCSVYGDIFCFNPSIFSISVFSRLKFRFNSLFLSKYISFDFSFFDVHQSELIFLSAKIILKTSEFQFFTVRNIGKCSILSFLALKCSILSLCFFELLITGSISISRLETGPRGIDEPGMIMTNFCPK